MSTPTSKPLHSLHHLHPSQADSSSRDNADVNKRATSSTGLLSPNPSSSSLSSSPSIRNPSSSPNHLSPHSPRTPRTPVRSSYQHHQRANTASPASPPTTPTAKARPSPLFRLLVPFSPVHTQTSTSTTNSTPSSPTMTLHHPAPQYTQPSNPSASTQRPPSRSERLLRDALLRDDMDRRVPASPLASAQFPTSPSPTTKTNGHRRRHSHVPVSSTNTLTSTAAAVGNEQEYTRGSFLFRTAMNQNSPRSPSPTSSGGKQVVYGGDAEGSAPSTPHRGQFSQQQQEQAKPTTRRGMSPVSNPRSVRSEHSPSPSPMRRKVGPPPPLPLGNANPAAAVGAGLQRHHTVHNTPSRSNRMASSTQPQQESPSSRQKSRPPPIGLGAHQQQAPSVAPGEPLLMTPHEQVLRARLERVLNAGRVVEQKDAQRTRGRSESASRSNEVRDEEGGWPWKDQVATGSYTPSPLYSSSGSSSRSSQQQLSHPLSAPRTTSRTRSKTDPYPPNVSTRDAAPSPRRSTTTPNMSPSTGRRASVQHRQRTGTTPPLMPDISPIVDGHVPAAVLGEDGDLRLLTPPPTPPFTERIFSLGGGPGPDGYCPSPYKTQYPANVHATTRRGAPPAKAALGAARRPTNAPLGRYSSSSEHDDDESSCSSQSFPPSSMSSSAKHPHPLSPPVTSASVLPHHHRPEFNARKASAQCRAMGGYVSFADVEGLGAPPADPMSPTDDGDDAHERGRKGPAGVLAWGVGGFRRLLGVVGTAEGHGHGEEPRREGVVL